MVTKPSKAVPPTARLSPAEMRKPGPKHTHRITIPGTTFVAFIAGEDVALKLAKRLSKTRIAPRKLAKPIIDELVALDA